MNNAEREKINYRWKTYDKKLEEVKDDYQLQNLQTQILINILRCLEEKEKTVSPQSTKTVPKLLPNTIIGSWVSKL